MSVYNFKARFYRFQRTIAYTSVRGRIAFQTSVDPELHKWKFWFAGNPSGTPHRVDYNLQWFHDGKLTYEQPVTYDDQPVAGQNNWPGTFIPAAHAAGMCEDAFLFFPPDAAANFTLAPQNVLATADTFKLEVLPDVRASSAATTGNVRMMLLLRQEWASISIPKG
jgi:hypothetical protein